MKYVIPLEKQIRIAISGKSGCGNTTVSTILANTLGINMINYTFRTLASETGESLASIIEKAKTDDSYDIRIDTWQVEMAQKSSCVLGSRLAIWMLKDADLKVYLFADEKTRAERILNREGGEIEKIISFTSMRDREDSFRYRKLYNIDNNDYSFADLIIDTSLYSPDKIVQQILDELVAKKLLQIVL